MHARLDKQTSRASLLLGVTMPQQDVQIEIINQWFTDAYAPVDQNLFKDSSPDDLLTNSQIECEDPIAAMLVGEYLEQFDTASLVTVTGRRVYYRS